MGFPKLTAVQSFQVRVLDENDERPVFTPRDYHTEIYENNPPGKLIRIMEIVYIAHFHIICAQSALTL